MIGIDGADDLQRLFFVERAAKEGAGRFGSGHGVVSEIMERSLHARACFLQARCGPVDGCGKRARRCSNVARPDRESGK
ncbi:Uncharacterised protein [Bordetella pertussis]|nr:Uncharacterised protein [Bordetella pertussis]